MTYAWFDEGDGRSVYRKVNKDAPARSDFPCPRIAGDSMAPVQAMTDGTWHDSKSSIRANYKRHGAIEVGNDPARNRPFQRPKIDRAEVKATIEKATARYERGERAS